MANASLNIPITGDASQFLAEVNKALDALKILQTEFNSALTTKGKKLKLDVEVASVEGSISDLKAKIKELEAFRDNLPKFDIANYESANRQIKEYKDEIKRLQGIGVKIDIDPPPPGSINDIKRQISELSQQKGIAVGIDLTNANIKLQELKSLLKSLETQGIVIDVEPISPVVQNSIGSLEKELLELRAAAKNIDLGDETEIARLNDKIKELEATIQRYKGLSIDPNGKLTQSSAKARQAITSLSLVAQDAAFGFIAIQNNLPAVLQTFTELEAKNKGLKGTFKELATALVGPAGFFLAFSAITGAVTFLVKEYGSLSNAMKVLFSENGALTKAQLDFNKEINKSSAALVVEDSKIRTLTKALLDSKTPRKEQISYYEELKRLSPDIVSGIDKENLGTDEANRLLSQNILLRAELVKLEIQEGGIKAVAAKNAEALAIARDEEAIAQKNLANATAEYNLVSRNSGQNPLAIKGAASLAATASSALDAARAKISDLTKVQERYLGQLDPITLRVAQINGKFKEQSDYLEELRKKQQALLKGDFKFSLTIDSQALDEAFNLDKIISNLTKYGNALIDVNNSEKERKNALRELLEINPEYFASFDLNKNRVEDLKGRIESFIRTLLVEKKAREDAAGASKINTELRKAEEKGVKSLGDKYNYFADSVNSIPTDIDTAIKLSEQFDEIGNNTIKATQANNKFIESLKLGQEIIEILQKGLNLKESYNNAIEDLLNFSEYSRQEIEKISKDLRFLQEPLEGLFTTLLDEGKLSWKAFADDVVKQIKRIAAALLSKAIIQGIANLLAPGSGAIVRAGLKGIDTAILGSYGQDFSWLNSLPTGRGGRSANFNRVIGERSMAMSGQVNMVIRGSDLVGAMNRTNSTISRVG